MKCGFNYINPKIHQCRWFGNNKLSAKCQVDACPEGAVVCKKMHKMNMSSDLKNWLRKVKINPKDIANSLVVGTTSIGDQDMKFKHNSSWPVSIPISKISKADRDKLQRGIIERWMTDEEVSEFFETGFQEKNVR